MTVTARTRSRSYSMASASSRRKSVHPSITSRPEPHQSVVPLVDASPRRTRGRPVELDLGVDAIQDSVEVLPGHALVEPLHDLHVLLRHRLLRQAGGFEGFVAVHVLDQLRCLAVAHRVEVRPVPCRSGCRLLAPCPTKRTHKKTWSPFARASRISTLRSGYASCQLRKLLPDRVDPPTHGGVGVLACDVVLGVRVPEPKLLAYARPRCSRA